MDSKALQIIDKELKFDRQGISIIKSMMFVYAIMKSKTPRPVYIEGMVKPVAYLESLYELAEQSIPKLQRPCGKEFIEIINQCLDDFDPNVSDSHATTVSILWALDNLTIYDIQKYFISDTFFSTERFPEIAPDSLNELAIELLANYHKQRWLDMGCGQGNLLARLRNEVPGDPLYGIDVNADCSLISKIHLYFEYAHYQIIQENVLFRSYEEFVDVAFANLPFLTRLAKESEDYNAYNKYVGDLRSVQNADWIFADRLLQCIKDRGIIIMTEGSLMNTVDLEQRKNIIDKNLVEGVIKLPSSIFANLSISLSLVIFNKRKKDNTIKFLDATQMCKCGRRLSELNVDEIANAYRSPTESLSVDIEEIVKNDYSLQVKQYVIVNGLVLKNATALETLVQDVFRGAQIPASVIDEESKIGFCEKTCRLISVGDIKNGTFNFADLQIIKDSDKYDRYVLKEGDVLVSAKGTKIKTAVVSNTYFSKIIATGSLIVIRCDQEKLNPYYLKAFFDSRNGAKLLDSIQSGTSIISINASALMKMKISLLDKADQDGIASSYVTTLGRFLVTSERLRKLERSLGTVFDDYTRKSKRKKANND